jgi:dihydrofolate reductase
MEIILIAAMARNRVIGRDNRLPWHIPAELRLFKQTTMGYPMIMGRRTFEALPGLLPGRRHIILSRNRAFSPAGAEVVGSFDEALQLCAGSAKVFVIGGADLFSQTMAAATGIILTLIDRDVAGDVFFPEVREELFAEVSRVPYPEGEQPFTVVTYQRRQG